jgi:serine/threonine-protein kinase
MIGETVGNYRILEKLGEGGMGAVFKGLDLTLEREVALKMLRSDLVEQSTLIDRFRAEAITLARLIHPNIAILFNFFRHNEDYFMVLEYVRGQTLSAVIKERGAMPWAEAVGLIEQVLDGLAHAHKLNIIHRDLKPGNLMLTEACMIKITDFGIARVLGTSRMTRPGGVVGTLEYMAPERIRGLEADARSDIYSVGIVLYELLTGHAPFHSDSDYELMRAQIEAPPLPPHVLVPNLPNAVEQTILRALQKAPEERYQTAREMRDALRAAIHAPPPVIEPPIKKPPQEVITEPVYQLNRETVPLSFPSAARFTEPIAQGGAAPLTQGQAPPLQGAAPTEIDLSPVGVTAPLEPESEVKSEVEPKVEPAVELAIEPGVDPEVALDADPSFPLREAEIALQAPSSGVDSPEPSADLQVAFTPSVPERASIISRLTWKHYVAAAAGLAILLFAVFMLLRPKPEQELTVTPTPTPSSGVVTVASPSPLPTAASATQPGLAASPQPTAPPPVKAAASQPSPEKAASGKGAPKPKPDKDAEAREKERRRREILKALQQKDNQ